jgi:hypothetical protein
VQAELNSAIAVLFELHGWALLGPELAPLRGVILSFQRRLCRTRSALAVRLTP